jgi:cysteine-rich repeat protein
MRRLLVPLLLFGLTATTAQAFGPVAFLGVDAEDGADGLLAHGPIATYSNLVETILSKATNGGSGILVIGAGKDLTTPDQVTLFWDTISALVGVPVTFANGPAAIATQPFDGFAMLAVASTEVETASGGLTEEENAALSARQSEVALFVNAGGGLLGFSQFGLTDPYGYAVGLGAIALQPDITDFDQIEPTPEGLAVGVDASLSVCCWHDAFTDFPPFLEVLALGTGEFNPRFGEPVAIGGCEVTLPGCGDGETGADEECDDGNNEDGDGCSRSCELENTPPDCSAAAATLDEIWPPNHKLVSIEVEGVTDADGDTVEVMVSSVFQDEPLDGIADGRTCPDASGVGTPSARVRAERSGSRRNGGNGRVYHIEFTASDDRGGACTGEVVVCVPHDRRRGGTCVDDGPRIDSTGPCDERPLLRRRVRFRR